VLEITKQAPTCSQEMQHPTLTGSYVQIVATITGPPTEPARFTRLDSILWSSPSFKKNEFSASVLLALQEKALVVVPIEVPPPSLDSSPVLTRQHTGPIETLRLQAD